MSNLFCLCILGTDDATLLLLLDVRDADDWWRWSDDTLSEIELPKVVLARPSLKRRIFKMSESFCGERRPDEEVVDDDDWSRVLPTSRRPTKQKLSAMLWLLLVVLLLLLNKIQG